METFDGTIEVAPLQPKARHDMRLLILAITGCPEQEADHLVDLLYTLYQRHLAQPD